MSREKMNIWHTFVIFSGENLLNLSTLDPRFFFFLRVCDDQFYPWVCFSSNLTQNNFLFWTHFLGWCAHPHLLNFWDWPFKSKTRKSPLFRLFPMPSFPQMNFGRLWQTKHKFPSHKGQIVMEKLFVFMLFMWLLSNSTKLSLSFENRKNLLTHRVFKSAEIQWVG